LKLKKIGGVKSNSGTCGLMRQSTQNLTNVFIVNYCNLADTIKFILYRIAWSTSVHALKF